jgi:MHS family proline/betaine transporter-like MFS transporter
MTDTHTGPSTAEIKEAAPPVVRKATLAGAVGSFVEWYDYGIYGLLTTYLALSLMGGEDIGDLLLTNIGFLVSFVARPFGSVICGYIGDKIGRRNLLAVLLILISGATLVVGLIPSHAAIGVAAPIILIAMRIIQGFSAGGEVAGAMSFVGEYARDRHRNFSMSFVAVGSFFALLFGSTFSATLITVLGDDSMESWGWRLPFLLAGPLGLVGYYIRTRLEETPQFQALRERREVKKNPLRTTFTSRRHILAIVLTIFLPALNGPGYYLLFTYMPTYLRTSLGEEHNFSMVQALLVNACGLVVVIIAIPLFARLSDRIGRKPVLIGSAVASAAVAFPCFLMISTGHAVLAGLSTAIMALCFAGHAAVIHTALTEMFPTSVRYSAYSIGFSLSTIIFGGSAPLVMTQLIAVTGDSQIPAYATILTGIITLISVFFLRETKGQPLKVD